MGAGSALVFHPPLLFKAPKALSLITSLGKLELLVAWKGIKDKKELFDQTRISCHRLLE